MPEIKCMTRKFLNPVHFCTALISIARENDMQFFTFLGNCSLNWQGSLMANTAL